MGQSNFGMTSGLATNVFRFDSASMMFSSVTSVPAPFNRTVNTLAYLDGNHIISGNFLAIWDSSTLANLYADTSGASYTMLTCKDSQTCYASDNSTAVPMKIYKISISNPSFTSLLSVTPTSYSNYSNCTAIIFSLGDLIMICDYWYCGFIYGSNMSLLDTTYTKQVYPNGVTVGYNDAVTGRAFFNSQLVIGTGSNDAGYVMMYYLYNSTFMPRKLTQFIQDGTTWQVQFYIGGFSAADNGQLVHFFNKGYTTNNKIYVYEKSTACTGNCAFCGGGSTSLCFSCVSPYYASSTNTLQANFKMYSCGSISCTGSNYVTTTNACSACSANCLTCSGLSTNCTTCFSGLYVSAANYTCETVNSGYFLNTAINQTQQCSSNCLTCSGSATACVTCTSGNYLSAANSSCGPVTAGYYLDVAANQTKSCDPNCLTCLTTSTTCTTCSSGTIITGTNCLPCDSNCLTCSSTAGNCTSCSSGLILAANATCQISAIQVTLSIFPNPKVAQSVDYSLIITIATPTISDASTTASLLRSVPIDLQFLDSISQMPDGASRRVTTPVSNDALIINVVFTNLLQANQYFVIFNSSQTINLTIGGTAYQIAPLFGNFSYKNPNALPSQLSPVENQAVVISSMTAWIPAKDSTSAEVVNIAVSADPTGIVMRFAQIIKLLNRVYYLNINFGNKLGHFLKQIEFVSGTKTQAMTPEYMLQSKLGTRGKLSSRGVVLSFLSTFGWRSGLYVGSWGLKALSLVVVSFKPVLPKFFLIIIYFLPKLHILIFNSVFIDFTFYATHTLSHSNNARDLFMSATILILMSIEIIGMFRVIFRERPWQRYYLMNRSPLLAVKRKADQIDDQEVNSTPPEAISPTTQPSANRLGELPSPQPAIDYKATYKNIEENYHMVKLLNSNLSIGRQAYKIEIARCSMIMYYTRLMAYQLLITVGQYVSMLAIICLLCFDLSKLIMNVRLYRKHQIFYNMMVLGVECCQCFFLSIFMLICTYLDTLKMKEAVNETLQIVCITLIFLAIITEYLFTLLQLATLVIDVIKDKMAEKRYLKKNPGSVLPSTSFTWFIQYLPLKIDNKSSRLHDSTVQQFASPLDLEQREPTFKINTFKVSSSTNTNRNVEDGSSMQIISRIDLSPTKKRIVQPGLLKSRTNLGKTLHFKSSTPMSTPKRLFQEQMDNTPKRQAEETKQAQQEQEDEVMPRRPPSFKRDPLVFRTKPPQQAQ